MKNISKYLSGIARIIIYSKESNIKTIDSITEGELF